MDDELFLINRTREKDSRGVLKVNTITSAPIKCKVRDVSAREFFDGGRSGLNPELQFTIFAGDYEDETVLEYDGKTYAIYRHYQTPGTDYMELYAQREGGTNGIQKGDSGNAGG